MCPSPVTYTLSPCGCDIPSFKKSLSLSWVWFSGLLPPKVGAWMDTNHSFLHPFNKLRQSDNMVPRAAVCTEHKSCQDVRAGSCPHGHYSHPGREQSVKLSVTEVGPGVVCALPHGASSAWALEKLPGRSKVREPCEGSQVSIML